MKKIVLIGFLSVLCLNVFSQVELLDPIEETKKSYAKAKTTDEKLDVIFSEILYKQIFDYKALEKEKIKWHKKYKDTKEGSSNKKLKYLELEKINLDSEISNLRITINNQIQEISDLKRNKKDISEIKKREKNRVEAEIKEIFKHKELISEDLLKITKERALVYQVDKNVISDLNTFIDLSKKVMQAQNLLSKRLNDSEVKNQLNALKNIRTIEFPFIKIKINSMIILLEEYCDKNQDLFDKFETVDKSGYTDEDLKDLLSKQRSLFISFPFLFDEITKKMKDISYISQVQECY